MRNLGEFSPSQKRELPALLDAFADVLEHPDLPESIVELLAERLDDIGGARYGTTGGPLHVAHTARDRAKDLREAFRNDG